MHIVFMRFKLLLTLEDVLPELQINYNLDFRFQFFILYRYNFNIKTI